MGRHTLYLGSDFRDDCRDKRWESRFQNNFKMDSSGVSWSRVRALPFFNMSQIRQLMNGNNPVYGVPRFGNRDFLNTGFVDDDDVDEYDYDKSENMEDESNIRIPTFNELLRRQRPELEGPSETESQSSGLSGDSLAFTLVYVSVFSVTLLYVGLKLAKRWRARQNRVSSTEESPTNLLHGHLPDPAGRSHPPRRHLLPGLCRRPPRPRLRVQLPEIRPGLPGQLPVPGQVWRPRL